MSTSTLRFGTMCCTCLCNRCHSRSEKDTFDVFITDQFLRRFCSTFPPSHRLLLLLIVLVPFIEIRDGYPEISGSGSLCHPQCMLHRGYARTSFCPHTRKCWCLNWCFKSLRGLLDWQTQTTLSFVSLFRTYLLFLISAIIHVVV